MRQVILDLPSRISLAGQVMLVRIEGSASDIIIIDILTEYCALAGLVLHH